MSPDCRRCKQVSASEETSGGGTIVLVGLSSSGLKRSRGSLLHKGGQMGPVSEG